MTPFDAMVIAGIALLAFCLLGHYWAAQDLEREQLAERLRRSGGRRR